MKTQMRDSKGRFIRLSKTQATYFTVEVRPSITVRDAKGKFMSYDTIQKKEVHSIGETTIKVRNIKSNRNPSVSIDSTKYDLNADIRVIKD
jgi:hypothetical protein